MKKYQKSYRWVNKGHEVTTTLVKNGIWRWYTSSHGNSVSCGQTAITHWGAARQYKREVNDYYARIKRVADTHD